jgi:hypothetical protein
MSAPNQKRHPVSLKQGATTAARRVIAAATAVVAAPTLQADGFAGGNAKKGHIVVKHDGTTVSFRVWLWLDVAGLWVLHPTLGTVVVAAANSPSYKSFDLDGADRVAVEITVATGPFTDGIDVWLAGNSQ